MANTGCYAVATILALAPLVAAGVAEPDDVVVTSASGTSGAGRSAMPHLLGSEVMGDLIAVQGRRPPARPGDQAGQRRPVAVDDAGAGADAARHPGLRQRCARSASPTIAERSARCSTTAYADEPFVHVLPAGQQPHTAATAGSNSAHLQASVDVDSGRIIVTSAIDNLGKGAAGQALQNANIMLGLAETAGLSD